MVQTRLVSPCTLEHSLLAHSLLEVSRHVVKKLGLDTEDERGQGERLGVFLESPPQSSSQLHATLAEYLPHEPSQPTGSQEGINSCCFKLLSQVMGWLVIQK